MLNAEKSIISRAVKFARKVTLHADIVQVDIIIVPYVEKKWISLIKIKIIKMAICKRCPTVLVQCNDCYGSGRKLSGKCIKCNGTGKLCQIHGANHGN